MTTFLEISGLLLAYLLGAIPFGFILTKISTGKNIMHEGSGNVGSTNVRRIAGKRISFYTQVLDILKGLLPVGMYLLFNENVTNDFHPYYVYGLALAPIIGHDFSIFLGFKGGKGVNTTMGASFLLAPWSVVAAGLSYFIIKKVFKYVSMGSIMLAIALPLVEILINGSGPTFVYLITASLLIIILHRKNIKRLLAGEENL